MAMYPPERENESQFLVLTCEELQMGEAKPEESAKM
jgi:hypothetical protein